MAADNQLVVNLAQLLGQRHQQGTKMRVDGGAAALEHKAAGIILDQDPQPLGDDLHLDIGHCVRARGQLVHQPGQGLQIGLGVIVRSFPRCAVFRLRRFNPGQDRLLPRLSRLLVLSGLPGYGVFQRHGAQTIKNTGPAVEHGFITIALEGHTLFVSLGLNDPQHHEQGHHGQGEVGKRNLPRTAVQYLMAALGAAFDDDLLAQFVTPSH